MDGTYWNWNNEIGKNGWKNETVQMAVIKEVRDVPNKTGVKLDKTG